jgi:hypothetical protein
MLQFQMDTICFSRLKLESTYQYFLETKLRLLKSQGIL